MTVIPTAIPEVILVEPRLFRDARGTFFESYNQRSLASVGINATFVQDNHSSSLQGVLRGMHYQVHQPQGKLVRVVAGEVLDVAVDLRRSSPFFGRWVSYLLSAENHRIAWIPPGFAHGFLVRSAQAEFVYKTTDYYAPEFERILLWNDPVLNIDWQLDYSPLLSAKDAAGALLKDAETFA